MKVLKNRGFAVAVMILAIVLSSLYGLSKKPAVEIHVKEETRKYQEHVAAFDDVLVIRKKNWGYVKLSVETEGEFQTTLAFVEQCAFSAMHIFPYSRRAGTPAAKMPDQIPNAVKEERAHRAGALAKRLEEAYLDSWVGETLPVLFEEEKGGLWRGHAPNYVEVFSPGTELHNEVRQVKILRREGSSLVGQL